MWGLQILYDCSDMAAHAFVMTWKAYEEALQKDCSTPCQRINPNNGSGLGVANDIELATYDLCDVCGMDGNMIRMLKCGCCQEAGRETVACLACVPQDHARWVMANDECRHWRCRRCR